MFRVGFALLALLVPSVLPCGGHIGRRGGQQEDYLIHVHVVAVGKVFCAYVHPEGKSGIVSLELGNRGNPNSYRKINSTAFAGRSEGVEFALSGDYSNDPRTNCLLDEPRISVRGQCGDIDLENLKPVYEEELGGKNQFLHVYSLGDIHPIGPF